MGNIIKNATSNAISDSTDGPRPPISHTESGFTPNADALLHDNSRPNIPVSELYEYGAAGAKGGGFFARTMIRKGQRILKEYPLILETPSEGTSLPTDPYLQTRLIRSQISSASLNQAKYGTVSVNA